jgi:hypothetical protein
MTMTSDDLGVLSNLATAIGLFRDGSPNSDWFGHPDTYLKDMLSSDVQREALIAFVDDVLGGEERVTAPGSTTWLPVVSLRPPTNPHHLDVAVIITAPDGQPITIGLGLAAQTTDPVATRTTIEIPLFQLDSDAASAPEVFLLGQVAGRIRVASSVTIDPDPPQPGQARIGSIGLDLDIPTSAADTEPVFGLTLGSLQLPGAAVPQDIRISADGADELDDAVLDLVLSLVRSLAGGTPLTPGDARILADPTPGTVLNAVAGMLGLIPGDAIPDFPVQGIAGQGISALTQWLHDLLTVQEQREEWIGYLAGLFGGTADGNEIEFEVVSGVFLRVGLRVETGPTGDPVITPTLKLRLTQPGSTSRVEARVDLCRIDLVTGAATAVPSLGIWAAAGTSDEPVLDLTSPRVVRAETLRIGFALDGQRRPTFVLAADEVTIDEHEYAVLDLTSPDAVMDAVGNAVSDVADDLLGGLAEPLQVLLGLAPVPGTTTPTSSVVDLLMDPVGTITEHWQTMLTAHRGDITAALEVFRDALADSAVTALDVEGTGTGAEPWQVPLVGPLGLHFWTVDERLLVGLVVSTSVDSLGPRAPVIEGRLGVTLADLDLANRSASLLTGVEARLGGRERDITPSRARLVLSDSVAVRAASAGVRIGWSPGGGLVATADFPDLALEMEGSSLPIALPIVDASGAVTLPDEAWDLLQDLVGHLAEQLPDVVRMVTDLLGWTGDSDVEAPPVLRLADLVADPAAAIGAWAMAVSVSELAPRALVLLADLLTATQEESGVLLGSGHPDDPFRLDLGTGDPLPELVVWFPPEGLLPRVGNVPESLRNWAPGQPGLDPAVLANALEDEAEVAAEVAHLIEGRDVVGGLNQLAIRWRGSDGRIVPPATAPADVRVVRYDVAAGQLLAELNLAQELGRIPTTTVWVALGATAWQDKPADRVVDLTAPGLAPTMFTAPPAAAGDWFVRLGSRAACTLPSGDADGTAGQAARLRVVLDQLAPVGTDTVVVGVAGAGHACRSAAAGQSEVSDVVTLGTPYSAISLSAVRTLPEADGLRLLHRLLPPPPGAGDQPDDADLSLARALVASLMELSDRERPEADLAQAVTAPPSGSGLTTTAIFGVVSDAQISRAMTAAVAAGLARRAQQRADAALPPATGVRAGIRFVLPDRTDGTLRVTGDALLTLAGLDLATDTEPAIHVSERELRVRSTVSDRLGWLTSTPTMELRKVSADVHVPLGGGAGSGAVTLHDARVLDRSWEQLVIGPGAEPLIPEARSLLAAAVQRLADGAAGSGAAALEGLLEATGLTAAGAAAFDGIDQLVRDPGGLLRSRLQAASAELSAAVATALDLPGVLDIGAGTITITTATGAGLFGWAADVTVSPTGVAGTVAFGPADPSGPAGALQLLIDLSPLRVQLHWQRPGEGVDVVELWPHPDPAVLARALAAAAPGLGGQLAIDLLRADSTVQPVIDAVLDALGLLSGTAADAERRLRPLFGLIGDPAGWLRSADSLAGSPAKIQQLLDALRPMAGVGGNAGDPWMLADGVSLAVLADGPAARLELAVDASAWSAPAGSDRIGAGLLATLTLDPSGPPLLGLDMYVGLPDAEPGRQAIHARVDETRFGLFVRPETGADISLLPFEGLGGLAAAAERALPFLLDALAAQAGDVGTVVSALGDALGLRGSDAPKKFEQARLAAWAQNPAGALQGAIPTLTPHLVDLAARADAFAPTSVAVTSSGGSILATAHGVIVDWNPASATVSVSGAGLEVPGIDRLTFRLTFSPAGLDELSVTAGPAEIDTGPVTVQPFVTVAAGLEPVGGRRVMVGLAVDDTHRFAAKWTLDPAVAFSLVASDGPVSLTVPTVDDADLAALRAVEVIADVVAAVAMSLDEVEQILDKSFFAGTIRDLLLGVVLKETDPTELVDGLFAPATLVTRAARLFQNIAGAGISIEIDQLTLSLTTEEGVVGLKAEIENRWSLLEDDISLWLENDDSWIDGNPVGDGGVFVGFLEVPALTFAPHLHVWGVGLRIGRSSGPLLDIGLTLESVALHAFAKVGGGTIDGGAQLQLSNLAISAAGASGGNGIAAGIVRDTGNQPPRPAFSPAIAVQKHGDDDVSVTLRAGVGDGPWWIAIQKGFGPLYLQQVGLGVELENRRVDEVSLFLDGSVSLFGLTCAVDDLQITYLVSKNDFFNPAAWEIDLAGLAVSADMAGLSIAGGLLKHEDPNTRAIEYLGMLLARFGVYGITIYGGYGEGDDHGQKFVAFFAVGAVVGPIGGPPAFFLTGIGGGFGINRELVVPTDLSRFGDYPLIQALDVAATPGNPMDQLRALGQAFPMKRGNFWFAAGLSFNSFGLVDGIAVVAVEVGDGLDINLLGLARMALPRPQAALVSIEIALLVRFSSSEGVLWVQGQLTDNSWLLYSDVRLTGGFAFVTWFKGQYRGQFVLTLGGYHPDFSKPGYPEVPRLGMRWQYGSNIVIQAGSYFALTSEAVMAGGDFSASARFGWAWAEVGFGAHGIIFFDPFRYNVRAYARIDAGITIEIWPFGDVSFSVHVGARVEVEGPDFHGRATVEVGPCEVTVEFGNSGQSRGDPLGADPFVTKYLEPSDGGAITLSIITTYGVAPSGSGDITPDGTAQRPYKVVAEFGLIVTSTVPITDVTPATGMASHHAPSSVLGVAPMGTPSLATTLLQSWQHGGGALAFPFTNHAGMFGAFPIGVWGAPQDENNRKLPKGDVVQALSEVSLDARATISAGGPEIPYHQVEIGKRIPLPFSRTAQQVADLRATASALSGLVTQPGTADEAFALAESFLAQTASPTALAALRGERQAPPRPGTLGEGLDVDAITVRPGVQDPPVTAAVDTVVAAPMVVGLLRGGAVAANATPRPVTTVKDAARLWWTAPPTLATVDAERSRSIATTLVTVDAVAAPLAKDRKDERTRRLSAAGLARAAAKVSGSVVATGSPPPTAVGHAPGAAVERVGGSSSDQLRMFGKSLAAGRRTGAGNPGAVLNPGDVAVLRLPNARRDVGDDERPLLLVAGAPARILALSHGADLLADEIVGDPAGRPELAVPQGTERLVALGLGAGQTTPSGMDGWHAGALVPYLGWSCALGRGCVLRARGAAISDHPERLDAGWVTGAELARGQSTVSTRFTVAIRTVVIALDDPASLGDAPGGRKLVLALDGAERVRDARGDEAEPVLLTAENRTVLAYAVAPTGGPVTVTVATEHGWSLVGVLGAADLSAEAAIALISSRGLDAALRPLASGSEGLSRLVWQTSADDAPRTPPRRKTATRKKAR